MFSMDGLRIRFAGETNVGMKRTHNEDNLHVPTDDCLAIVADGMGGHASGEIASQMAVETIVEFFKRTADDAEVTWPFKLDRGYRFDISRLVTGIKLANVKIYEAAQREPKYHGMGTTLVSALFRDGQVLIGHVGDSRLYRLRDGEVTQITEDHSLLNDYIKMKKLSAQEIESFPHKNVIVRALGMKETVQVDIYTDRPRLDDVYLLCSDGLSSMISDQEISATLKRETDMARMTERLIAAANAAGGTDNITVVLARLERA
jgi:protein phosphatase